MTDESVGKDFATGIEKMGDEGGKRRDDTKK
jgi:hypothetical protein